MRLLFFAFAIAAIPVAGHYVTSNAKADASAKPLRSAAGLATLASIANGRQGEPGSWSRNGSAGS